jgi:hypothetical protein
MDLQHGADEFPKPSEVIVDAEKLSPRERALILYRHCKAAALTDEQKALVRRWARKIIDSRHFTPERLRRFVLKRLNAASDAIAHGDDEKTTMIAAIGAEIEEPTDGMRKSFANLSPEHQSLLVSMLDTRLDPAPSDSVAKAYKRHAPPDGRTPERVAADLASHFIRQGRRSIWHNIQMSGKSPR